LGTDNFWVCCRTFTFKKETKTPLINFHYYFYIVIVIVCLARPFYPRIVGQLVNKISNLTTINPTLYAPERGLGLVASLLNYY